MSTNYRYERKFVFLPQAHKNVQMILKTNPSIFREIYSRRRVNSVYFDTENLRFFYENIDGVANRVKIRLRWYGDLFGHINNPTLELKIKNGHIGHKLLYKIDDFKFNKSDLSSSISEIIRNSSLPMKIKNQFKFIKPTILTRYKREYYISFNRHIRATLDSNIESFGFQSNLNIDDNAQAEHQVILELKYPVKYDEEASSIASFFNHRLNKNSKYVNAVRNYYMHSTGIID